jgi:hypothetical protein
VAVGIVVRGTVAPGVAGDVVVVPHGRDRDGRVQALEVRVAALLGVAPPVVGERGRRLGRVVRRGPLLRSYR